MTTVVRGESSGAEPTAWRNGSEGRRIESLPRTVALPRFDPDLAAEIPPERLGDAERLCVARVVVSRGPALEPNVARAGHSGYGLLILHGAFCRRITQEGRVGAELLGPGDLMRPSDPVAEWSTLPVTCAWKVVVGPVRLAVLDAGFARRAASFPEIAVALNCRSLRRTARLAAMMSAACQPRVENRLTMLFWHLADRFGKTRPDGSVRIPLPLTHSMLAEMVAARRPSVTTALARMRTEGRIARDDDGWLLRSFDGGAALNGGGAGTPAETWVLPADS